MECASWGGSVSCLRPMQVKKMMYGSQQMMKTPSTAARVTVALCSLSVAPLSNVDERVKDGVAARIRRT